MCKNFTYGDMYFLTSGSHNLKWWVHASDRCTTVSILLCSYKILSLCYLPLPQVYVVVCYLCGKYSYTVDYI